MSRSDLKTQSVTVGLRRKIVSGRWRPGAQLPTWSDLESTFDVGRTSLNRALRQLKRDGFIYASSTRGTFVAERPPHLYRYGLVFPTSYASNGWNRFWSTLSRQSSVIAADRDIEIAEFQNVCPTGDLEANNRLLTEADSSRFAGVIFVGASELMLPQLKDADLPRVAISSHQLGAEEIPHVYNDRDAFEDRVIARLKEIPDISGVAVLSEHVYPFANFGQKLVETGFATRSSWLLQASGLYPTSATSIVELLLNRPAGERPNVLVITDDNLVDAAIAGVLRCGLRVPGDLRIIAHCNFPADQTGALPVERLGFDANEVIGTCLRLIDAQRMNQPVPGFTALPPRWANEPV